MDNNLKNTILKLCRENEIRNIPISDVQKELQTLWPTEKVRVETAGFEIRTPDMYLSMMNFLALSANHNPGIIRLFVKTGEKVLYHNCERLCYGNFYSESSDLRHFFDIRDEIYKNLSQREKQR